MKITKQESYTIELTRAELVLIYITMGGSSKLSRDESYRKYGPGLISKEEFDKVNDSSVYDQLDAIFTGKQ